MPLQFAQASGRCRCARGSGYPSAAREAPLASESQGRCRLRLIGNGRQLDVPFADADRARRWMDQLMSRARCDL